MSETFGLTVQRTRKALDISSMELATKIGAGFARMSDIERDRVEPTDPERLAIATALHWRYVRLSSGKGVIL